MRKENTERALKAVELYNTGMSVSKVSQELQINYQTAHTYIKKYGELRKYGTEEEIVKKIRFLYQEKGLTYREIAKELNMQPEKVHQTISSRRMFRESVETRSKKHKNMCDKIHINVVEDPIFYVEHKPTNERLVYGKKQYRDMSAMILGG